MAELDLFIFQVALLFVPGIVWAMIDSKYGRGRRPTISFFLIYAFIFGILTYLLLGFLYEFWNRCFSKVNFDIFDFADTGDFSFNKIKDEVLWSFLISLLFSGIWLRIQSKDYITSILQKRKISKTIARDEVWTNVFNRHEKEDDRYVRIKDFEKEIIIEGWVDTFSENDGIRELFIKSALILKFNAEKIDEIPFLYVTFVKERVWIEFPFDPDKSE